MLLRSLGNHPITRDLPWDDRPPLIGGFNQTWPKPGGEVIVEASLFEARHTTGGEFRFQLAERRPLLVLGRHGAGRTAAFMTDVAPHWVAPLVDWGTPRISAQAPNANAIEVGGWYAQFLKQLLDWTRAEA